MTEREGPDFDIQNEARLTKKIGTRTLKTGRVFSMEEGNGEQINPEEMGINPGESQAVREARRVLREALEEQERASGHGQNAPSTNSGEGGTPPLPPISEGGEDFSEESNEEQGRFYKAIQQIQNDPTRFEKFLSGIELLSPQDIREMFVLERAGKLNFFVYTLAKELEGQDDYVKKFNEALNGDSSQLHVTFRNIIHEIKEDFYRDYRQREEPITLQNTGVRPNGEIVEPRQIRTRRNVDERGANLEQVMEISRNQENNLGNAEIQDTSLKQMDVLADDIMAGGQMEREARQSISDYFEEQLQQIYDGRNKPQQKFKELNRILSLTNPEEVVNKLHQFILESDRERQKNIREGKEMVPQEIESIQDLARFIIRKQDSTLFGREGKYPLLKREFDEASGKEVDRFQPHNFLIWMRDQATKLHYDNATSEISFLNGVAIETQLRTISIYMMTRFRSQYFKDEVSGEVLDGLADQSLQEAWGFGVTRNMDLKYRQVMNSDGDLPKAIVALYAGNDLTRSTLLKDFSQMSDRFTNDPDGRDTKLGDAFMLAQDLYYNLPDLKELKYVAGDNSPMFDKKWFKNALMMQQGKLEWDGLDSTQFYDAATDTFFATTSKGHRIEVFDAAGRVNEKNYYQFINYFNDATPDDTKVAFIRELVRFTVAEKYGIKDGLMGPEEFAANKAKLDSLPSRNEVPESQLKNTETKEKFIAKLKAERRADRINLEWTENNSFVTLRPLLIAAKNDTGRRGYDAETKLSMLNYLLRQSGEGTAGPIGNPEALGIFRNLSVDALMGLKTESGMSPYDIFRFIRNMEQGGVRWVTKRMPDGSTRRVLEDFTKITGNDGKTLTLEQAISQNPGSEKVNEDEFKKLKAEYLNKLKFSQNAMVDYSANQINRAYEIFHSMSGGEQLNLGKIVSYDPWKGVIYDYSAFEDLVKDKFIKPMRYAFASNSALNYGSFVRVFTRLGPDGQPVFEDKLMVDHMFGRDVTDEIREDTAIGKYKADMLDDFGHPIKNDKGETMQRTLTYAEFVNTGEGRTRLVKNAARARFAAELRMHRKYGLAGERWNAEMVETMFKGLRTLKQYEEGPDGEIRETKKAFFTKEDIAWIRKHSGTQRGRLLMETYGKELGELAMGLPGLFGAFTAGLIDF